MAKIIKLSEQDVARDQIQPRIVIEEKPVSLFSKVVWWLKLNLMIIGLGSIGLAGYTGYYGPPPFLRQVQLGYLQAELDGTQKMLEQMKSDFESEFREIEDWQVAQSQKGARVAKAGMH